MHTKKTTYPPSNIWSTAYEDAVSQHTTHQYRNSVFNRISPIETSNSTQKTKHEQSDNNKLNSLKKSPFVRGLLIGFCVAGLILAISLSLWLTSSSSLTTHTTMTTTTTTTTTTMNCLSSGSTTQSPGGYGGASVLYTFDDNSKDYFSNYDATPVNNPQYVSPGYDGRGSAIQLLKTSSQCLHISNHMDFYKKSLTVEAWIYPLNIYIDSGSSYIDSIIYAQTNSSALNQYMWMMLRNGKNFGAFRSNDVVGVTLFQTNQWQHIAFTYDIDTKTQTAYINGVVDAVHRNSSPCEITVGKQTIGCYYTQAGGFFDGYIDHLTILFNKAKTAEQILADATLVAYYSMDCLNYTSLDSGPNQIHGITNDLSSGDGGRIGQSYLFNSTSSYFQASGFVLLGQSYRPYSFAMWLRPLVTTSGTIVHISRTADGVGWCVQFIGFNSTGRIIINSITTGDALVQIIGPVLKIGEWVHIAQTYSETNGLRLYVNGVLYGQSSPFPYAARGLPMIMTLGQPLSGSFCASGSIQGGQYYGQIDEFYLFSRELTQADVTALAQP